MIGEFELKGKTYSVVFANRRLTLKDLKSDEKCMHINLLFSKVL